jgi:hypothetical protein
MLVASAITWLFVSIKPPDEMMMPVPAARPCASVVLTFTIDGVTFEAIALELSAPVELLPEPDEPEPLPLLLLPLPVPLLPLPFLPPNGLLLLPLLPLNGFVNALLDDEFLCIEFATAAPTPADAITSSNAASTMPMRFPGDIDSAGGAAGGASTHGPRGVVGGVACGGPGGVVGHGLADCGGHDIGWDIGAAGWGCVASVAATGAVGGVDAMDAGFGAGDHGVGGAGGAGTVGSAGAAGAGAGAGGQDSPAAFQVWSESLIRDASSNWVGAAEGGRRLVRQSAVRS